MASTEIFYELVVKKIPIKNEFYFYVLDETGSKIILDRGVYDPEKISKNYAFQSQAIRAGKKFIKKKIKEDKMSMDRTWSRKYSRPKWIK